MTIRKPSPRLKQLQAALAKADAIVAKSNSRYDAAYNAIEATRRQVLAEAEAKIARECKPLCAKRDAAAKEIDHLNTERHKIADALNAERAKAWTPPATGAFIAWKKCRLSPGGFCVVKLRIPATAARMMLPGSGNRKCRASAAEVLAIESLTGTAYPKGTTALAQHDWNFTYTVGATVKPRRPFAKKQTICASGIHFYMLRNNAKNH